MSTVSSLGTRVSEQPLVPRSTAEAVNEMYNAFVAGDLDTAAQFVTPDFVGHVPGHGLNAGDTGARRSFGDS
ncbi:MAG: hypothetical protein ACRD1T_22240 [Acidimicrobiia bacterium]